MLEQADKSAVEIRRFDTARSFADGDMTVRVLPPLPGREKKNLNDNSIVTLVEFGKHRFLFPADLERAGEEWLLGQHALVPVTMTMAPHHGSSTSSTPGFIAATSPKHVVFSVGRRNRHRFPRPDVLRRWRQSGAATWRTDEMGTLIFQSDGTKVKTPGSTD